MTRSVWWLAALALAACSSSSSSSNGAGAGTNPGDTPGDDGGASDLDGGSASSDGGAGGKDGSASGPVKKGQINVAQTTTPTAGGPYYSSYASAYFFQYDPNVIGAACTSQTIAPCTVTECNLSGTTADAGASASPPNAGTITVTGAMIAGSITLTPTNTNGAYTIPILQSRIFSPGQTISVSASGGDVPAFSGKTVQTPSDITVGAPYDQSNQPAIPRSAPLTVAWTGASAGDVQVMIATSQQNVRSVSATCIFPASGGSGQIPQAAMGKLDRANGSSVYGSITIVPFVETTTQVAGWDVSIRATATGKSGFFTASN